MGELTPGQQFGYFARSNRQIEIDVLEIPVSEFVDQISDPDQKELDAYFARYKYQEPIFNNIAGVSYESPEPGFKFPHRVSVDYVKVNVDREVAKWIDQVTDVVKKRGEDHRFGWHRWRAGKQHWQVRFDKGGVHLTVGEGS